MMCQLMWGQDQPKPARPRNSCAHFNGGLAGIFEVGAASALGVLFWGSAL